MQKEIRVRSGAVVYKHLLSTLEVAQCVAFPALHVFIVVCGNLDTDNTTLHYEELKTQFIRTSLGYLEKEYNIFLHAKANVTAAHS